MGDRTRGTSRCGRRDADDGVADGEVRRRARVDDSRVRTRGFASEAAPKAAGITKETNIPGGVIEPTAWTPTWRLKELATAAM